MSDYNRTTRKCSVSQLHPELRQAIRNYFQEHNLGDPGDETLQCCETISEKKSTGRLLSLLNGNFDTIIRTGMLLTSQWLIWVRNGDRSGTVSTAANLKEISVGVHTSILAKDYGLEVAGTIVGSKSPMHGYIGMGPEIEAQEFCEEVKQAVIKANPPTPKSWPKWLGG
jgi:hypothetical protein